MDNYYIILTPLHFGALAKKMTYKQALDYMQVHQGMQAWKILKADYNRLAKSIKGVYIKDPIFWIFNRLHSEGKTERL